MNWTAAVDEVASETQLSEGWTYSLLSQANVTAIDNAVSGCTVKHFHGKEFEKAHAADYETLLKATRQELEKTEAAVLMFTLLDTTWKATYMGFSQRLISGSMKNVGASDQKAIKIAEHLFPGLLTLQRLISGLSAASMEIEIDSDTVTEKLAASTSNIKGVSVPTANLLWAAYEAYRKEVFPKSVPLAAGGLRVLDDAKARSIQIADVFGNFALAYIFVRLGNPTARRVVKAQILDNVFGDLLKPIQINSTATLVGNDIQLNQPGGLTLRIGMSVS